MPPSSARAFPLDGKLLVFDRDTGTNTLFVGAETAHLRQKAPRVLQVSLTNACNKDCAFCYRPMSARSTWSFDDIVALADVCDEWGVLELAFGGGEPTIFPRFAELLRTIWETTSVCPNFTTNGTRLTPELLRAIRGSYGQLQLSIYDEDDWRSTIDLLVRERARFGLNYLVTPARARTLEVDIAAFHARGVRDVLLLSYKGNDPAMHLSASECAMTDDAIVRLGERFGDALTLKIDVCWGSRLPRTPQLFPEDDCAAGVAFMSLTSDKRVLGCSFDDGGIALHRLDDLPLIWARLREVRAPALKAGCARLAHFGRAHRRSLPLVIQGATPQ